MKEEREGMRERRRGREEKEGRRREGEVGGSRSEGEK